MPQVRSECNRLHRFEVLLNHIPFSHCPFPFSSTLYKRHQIQNPLTKNEKNLRFFIFTIEKTATFHLWRFLILESIFPQELFQALFAPVDQIFNLAFWPAHDFRGVPVAHILDINQVQGRIIFKPFPEYLFFIKIPAVLGWRTAFCLLKRFCKDSIIAIPALDRNFAYGKGCGDQ